MDRNLRIRMLLEAGDRVTKPLRDMAGGSRKAAEALKATRDRLKEIDRAQAAIGSFRELKAGLRSTSAELHAAQDRVVALAQQIRAADSPTKKLTADFAKAKREASALGDEHREQSVRLQQLRDRMAAAGVSTRDLVQHERRLREEASRTNAELAEQSRRLQQASDRSRRFEAARGKFTQMQGAATSLAAGGAAAIGTGYAMGRPILGGITDAQAYQSAMTDIAQKANLSRREAEKMGAGLLVAAKAANQLPDALAQGVDALAGLGLDPRQAVQMMQPIGRAATAYKAEIADLSAAAFAANDNLKVPIDQTARVIDIMAQAGKAGAFEIKDMAGQFPALTAAYQALGQTGTGAVADLAAGAQIARKGAGDAATAGNNLLNLLNKINSKDTNANFKKFGVDLPAALKKAAKDGKGPIEAIAELTNKALGGDVSKLSYLFGDAQVQGALRPLIANLEQFKAIRAEALGANRTTDRDFAERMKDSAEMTRQLEVNGKALGISLGTVLLPTVNAITAKASAFTAKLAAWSERHPVLAKGILMVAAGLAATLIVLGVLGIVVAGLIAPFAALATVATFFSIGMLPLIGIVAGVVLGIVALGAAAYAIYANWGAISGWFAGVWEKVKLIFSTAMGAIAAVLSQFNPTALLLGPIGLLLGWLGGSVPGKMAEIGRNLIRGLINGIVSMLGALKSTIVNAASSAANWFKSKLGIHSPSRVFMSYGGHIMQGLTNGIAGGENGPVRRLDSLSKRMTAAIALGAATPAFATGAGGAGGPGAAGAAQVRAAPATGNRYEIHLHAAPGMDEAKLMLLLERKLNDLERAAEARARSSFADSPDWDDHA
ncbi:hypothetical protein BH11PSE6_BH11PSE6_14170 [soil metagenome]